MDDLTFALNEASTEYSVIRCSVYTHGNLVIPSEYKDLPVTSIGDSAFRGLDGFKDTENTFYSLKSVTIPDSVTSIEKLLSTAALA